eukprot:CAMPEP_0172777328 /NCGR_PEP_ID=MMETSP1074-20121228/201344_1 /TAXON_ID=2916 /ORGANISM="Ceratium fusus, Strain PA161109" /LENGTH=165 /DNA_ID=CAMNT_0013614241 /DNA_START=631 /DNA_END=1124 /DNA_ORIENTATION=-
MAGNDSINSVATAKPLTGLAQGHSLPGQRARIWFWFGAAIKIAVGLLRWDECGLPSAARCIAVLCRCPSTRCVEIAPLAAHPETAAEGVIIANCCTVGVRAICDDCLWIHGESWPITASPMAGNDSINSVATAKPLTGLAQGHSLPGQRARIWFWFGAAIKIAVG